MAEAHPLRLLSELLRSDVCTDETSELLTDETSDSFPLPLPL